MYRLTYRTKQAPTDSSIDGIESITIDKSDIEMMRYSKIFELKLVYLMFLINRRMKGTEKEEYVISNNRSIKGKVISAILSSRWLINADTANVVGINYYLGETKERFVEKLENPKKPLVKNEIPINEHAELLKYFIKTYDRIMSKEEEKAK